MHRSTIATGPPVAGMDQEAQGLRVLCVEDSDEDFALLTRYLSGAFVEQPLVLSRVVRLADALRLLQAGGGIMPFHVVLLDLSLPDSHGLATFSEIREAAPDVAVTVLSGNSDETVALEMVQMGAQDYIPKDSINGDLLRRSIIYASERQRLLTDVRRLNEQLVRAQEDLRQTQMQLFQAEKLDSLGRVAASVAHEVKNPLGTLQLGVDFFSLQQASLGEQGRRMLRCMQEAIERAECIIHEMLDFSRSEKLTIQPCAANEIVASAVRMIAHELIERKVAVEESYCGGNPLIRADRSKIEQVIINLVMNSAQAMPGGGRLEVSTATSFLDDAPRDEGLREMDLMKAGDEIVNIEVRDYGHGIAPGLAHRIFEPFFTTKPPGEGTGLGLPVSKRIVELHRGRLFVQNAEPPPGVRSRIILRRDSFECPASAISIP